jgi:hypothetical protein
MFTICNAYTDPRATIYKQIRGEFIRQIYPDSSHTSWYAILNQPRNIIYIKLHGLSPRANYTDRATAACRRSDCQLLRIEVPSGQCDRSLRPYSRFSTQEPLLSYQVAPQLYSRGWVDPVPNQLLFFSGSAGNRTRASGSVAKNSDHWTTEVVLLQTYCVQIEPTALSALPDQNTFHNSCPPCYITQSDLALRTSRIQKLHAQLWLNISETQALEAWRNFTLCSGAPSCRNSVQVAS